VREGIKLGILQTGAISECEIESTEEQSPVGFPGVQTLGGLYLGQVFMVSPHDKGGYRALQPVTPFFMSQLNCQEFLGSDVKIPLCR
jgi:hypothetical protein